MIHQIKHAPVITLINTPIILIKFLNKNLILLMCVYFPFLSSLSQNEEVDLHSCSNGKFTQFFYPSGIVSSQGCLDEGSAEGVWYSFFESGSIKSEGKYHQNKLEGCLRFYYSDYQIKKEINYSEDQKEGIENYYSEKGILKIQTNWKTNQKHGEEKRFFDSGKIQHVTYYIKGLKDGKCRQHAEDGRIIAFKTYKKGVIFNTDRFNIYNKSNKKTGIWKDFYESLVIKEEGPWSDGKKHGIFRNYDKRGNLLNIIRYKFGEQVVDEEILNPTEVIKTYHPNGKKYSETVYKNGIKHGVYREYNTKGDIIDGGIFTDGILLEKGITDLEGNKQGFWILFYSSGEKKAEGEYKDGKRIGAWIFYYETKEIEQKGWYKDDEYEGEWIWIFKNGDKKRSEQYVNGVEHGEFIEIDSLNNIILHGLYKNGLREGEWVYHVNDHKEEGEYISGQKNSIWTHTFSDGTIIFKGEYSFDEPVGVHEVWYSNGVLNSTGKHKNGLKHGLWKIFHENGEIDRIYKYKHGELIKVDGSKVQKSEKS